MQPIVNSARLALPVLTTVRNAQFLHPNDATANLPLRLDSTQIIMLSDVLSIDLTNASKLKTPIELPNQTSNCGYLAVYSNASLVQIFNEVSMFTSWSRLLFMLTEYSNRKQDASREEICQLWFVYAFAISCSLSGFGRRFFMQGVDGLR